MTRIERLTADAAEPYRSLMLQAYASAPEAFTATVQERAALPLHFWLQRLGEGPDADECSWGAWCDGRLVGAVALERMTRPKTRHKALLLGMYVEPELRGQGLGRQLVEALLAEARRRDGLRQIALTVTEGNAAAEALYQRCGFSRFGLEPLAVLERGRFLNKIHMVCLL
ncbi:GNAT family N-acetyltransferase [Pseudorhodoferax sp.]|uniref:GNAT family N-acetyltransferase n=1 Tax=Pseudorhodoferax sp. TaxID=1993553 RepID=UPI002DD6A412|nr:GNAT family N-acetyltransferase [Pseudorhodoferax sp.]